MHLQENLPQAIDVNDKASLFDDPMTASPCKKCPHYERGVPTIECWEEHKLFCPLDFFVPVAEKESPERQKRYCQFPGCKNELHTERGDYCIAAGHSKHVAQRKYQYPNRPDLWFVPKMKNGGLYGLDGRRRHHRRTK